MFPQSGTDYNIKLYGRDMQQTHQFVPYEGTDDDSFGVPQILLTNEDADKHLEAQAEKETEESKNNNNK